MSMLLQEYEAYRLNGVFGFAPLGISGWKGTQRAGKQPLRVGGAGSASFGGSVWGTAGQGHRPPAASQSSERHAFPGFRHPRCARVSTPALSTVAPEGGADIRGTGRGPACESTSGRVLSGSSSNELLISSLKRSPHPSTGLKGGGFRGQGRGAGRGSVCIFSWL